MNVCMRWGRGAGRRGEGLVGPRLPEIFLESYDSGALTPPDLLKSLNGKRSLEDTKLDIEKRNFVYVQSSKRPLLF